MCPVSICIQFDLYYFIVSCFAFNAFLSWFYFSILSLNIWFRLIFVSNLILILLIAIFFLSFLELFYFSISSLIVLFYLVFIPDLVIIFLLLFYNYFLDWFYFSISSLGIWMIGNFSLFLFHGVISVSWSG
jgi:hypothetical protein